MMKLIAAFHNFTKTPEIYTVKPASKGTWAQRGINVNLSVDEKNLQSRKYGDLKIQNSSTSIKINLLAKK